MMPHDGARVINDLLVRCEQAPAKIHIISRGAMPGIEETHCIESTFPKCHVATRNVFGVFVIHQNARRITRSLIHTLRYEAVLRWRKVWSSDGRRTVLFQGCVCVKEPVRISKSVAVDE